MLLLRTSFGLCTIVTTTVLAFGIHASNDEPERQMKAHDSIVATVTGHLFVTWDTGVVYHACALAGGALIDLDPAECPKVTRELLEYRNTQGGSVVTAVQVEATGNLVFEERPQSMKYRAIRYRLIGRDDIDEIVPVLRVQTIKITTLPLGTDIGPTKRERDTVQSTTVRRTTD